MQLSMAAKNQLPSTAPLASAAPPTKSPNGLWLDISPPLPPPHVGAALGPHGSQGLWLSPGQTQTLQAQGSRRYRLRLQAKQAPTEALTPAEQPLLVLRHGEDLWMSNAQAAGLVLNGFFATPDNQLDIELGEQAWRVDGLATGQPIAGSQAHLLYWHGQAAQWPDAFNVSSAEGGFELHKTQWQAVTVQAPAAEAASSQAGATTATASGTAAQAAGAAASATAGTAAGAAVVAEAAAASAVGVSGAAVGAVAVGVGAIAAASSGKTEAVTTTSTPASTPSTPSNLAPTAVALTSAITNNAILETASTATHTVVSSNDHIYHVYTVDSAHTQLLIDHNIVNAGRVL